MNAAKRVLVVLTISLGLVTVDQRVGTSAVQPVAEASDGQSFDASDFEPDDGADGWDWPSERAFHEQWTAQFDDPAAFQVVIAEVSFEVSDDAPGEGCPGSNADFSEAIIAIAEMGSEVSMRPVAAIGASTFRLNRILNRAGDYGVVAGVEAGADGEEMVYDSMCGRLTIRPDHVSEATSVRPEDLADRAYAATLLTFGDSLYEDAPEDAGAVPRGRIRELLASDDRQRREEAVEMVLDSDLSSSDSYWREILRELNNHGDDDLAKKVHQRFRPIGRCSMDTAPQNTARSYSEVCQRLGELGCFLKLRILIMDNRFQRVAASSMGERAHDPDGKALAEAPIDVERFFRGMTLNYAHDEDIRGASLGRMGQVVGIEFEEYIDSFMAMATDEDLDAYNRLRATQLLYFSAVSVGTEDDELLDRLLDASLTVAARHWVERSEEKR